MENNTYIYGLKCPEKEIIRYVGKSKKPKSRYSAHLSHTKAKRYDNIHLYRWIAKLLKNNLKPELAEKVKAAFFNFNWEGTGLAKEFNHVRPPQEKFMPITFKEHWQVVRDIDTAMNVSYECN